MSAVATAIVASSVYGANAAGDAADAQAAASLEAARINAEVQREFFNKNVELNAPFREAGLQGKNQLLTLLGLPGGDTSSKDFGGSMRDFSAKDFQADPGYAFRLSEGQKALDRSAAARGGLISGSALKAASRYGQEMGSQEYTNAFNRYQTNRANKLNPIQSLAGVGQSVSANLGNAAMTTGSNVGNALGQGIADAGAARASGYVGTANALNQGLGNYLAYSQNQKLLDKLS
jgi:hypothetical protein